MAEVDDSADDGQPTDDERSDTTSSSSCSDDEIDYTNFKDRHPAKVKHPAPVIFTGSDSDDHVDYEVPRPISTGPVLDIIYIAISKIHNQPSSKPVKIYGAITVNSYRGDKYYFYRRELDNPQRLKPCVEWNRLSLTRVPMAPVMGGKINVQLTNVDGDVPIFKRECDMNEAILNVDEGTFTLEQDGGFGYLSKMVFVKIPFAVIATVDARLYAPPCDHTKDDFFRVHGKISAQKVVFFEDRNGKGGKIRYGTRNAFRQLRNVVAVPVDSQFSIDVDLCSGNRKITKRSFTTPTGQATSDLEAEYNFRCKARGYRFGFDMSWTTQRDFFSYNSRLTASPRQSSPMVTGSGLHLVEVYSILFGYGNSSAPRYPDLDLYGTIVVLDGNSPHKEFCVFDSSRDGPDKLQVMSRNMEQQFRTISLTFPDDRWFHERNARMYLKLRDADGNKVCKGNLSRILRLDRRLCDIIKGERGYFAAVHYSVFQNARRADVFIECSNAPFSIYGSVFAQYDNYDYPSTYEQQFYRSIIFSKSKENPVEVKSGSKVPLLRSKVSAPWDCKELIVPVDLWIRRRDDDTYQRFEFNASTTGAEEGWGFLKVTVKWI